jgi:diguanylate cyclase (GGDEF)-like protein/putative nucleotidyltransferase with HDIG domain
VELQETPTGKEEPKTIPLAAKLYIGAVIFCGAIGAVGTLYGRAPHFSLEFLVYLLIGVASSGLMVTLPGVTGSISVNYVFTLLAMLQFERPEVLLLALVSVTAQTVWRARARTKPLHIFFNQASITLTVLSATFVYHLPWFLSMPEGQFFRLIIAGSIYFLTNALPVCIVIALTERRGARTIWKEFYSWSLPFYLVGASLAEMVHLSIGRLGWSFTIALLPLLYVMYRSYKLVIAKMEQEKDHAESMSALHLRTIEALAMAIEAKDECTHDHLRRVQVYSLKTAEQLGLSADDIRALQAASILHDIGKLAVPDYIISKPGKLTPEEFDRMKIHTVVGARILEQVGFPYGVPPIVRSHHEKWDGSGYPDGLKGEEIPIGARILSAVDCLDALASDRQYRRALPIDEALEYVVSLAGTSFDPQVVEILRLHYREFETLAQQAPQRESLDTHIVVSRGSAPDAGFEKDPAALPAPSGAPVRSFAESVAWARQEFQTILELTQDIGASLRLEETLSVVAERLKRLLPYDCIAIYVREGDVLRPRYVNGEGRRTFASLEIPIGQGISGWVVEHRKAVVNGNPSVEPAYLNDPSKSSSLNSALSVPLLADQFSGALTLYRAERDAYSKDHLRILLAVSGKIARVVERAIRLQQAGTPDECDQLTGLPHARSLYLHLEDELARCESQQKQLAVMICDLDGFKYVNDSFGQLTGNELLKEIARILRDNCRETDYVARMGGDEFVVLLPGAGREEIADRIERLDREIRLASRAACGEEKIGISVGVACFPDDGTDPEMLLSHADNDLYRAKRARKSGNVIRLPGRVTQVA